MSTETPEDARWKQRFQNFNLALTTLSEAHALAQARPLTKLEAQGFPNIIGPRNATRHAFKEALIENG
jgi:hypothetical protein